MTDSVMQCPACGNGFQSRDKAQWVCGSCGRKYPCVEGIPKLFLEENLGEADKDLRDRLYNALLGRAYNFVMPFLTIPARPIRMSRMHWLVYFLAVCILILSTVQSVDWIALRSLKSPTSFDFLASLTLAGYALFLFKHPYIAYLLLVAFPTKISLSVRPFKPETSFAQVHSKFQAEYMDTAESLRILDIATGSCNSLYRHGWTRLNAEYTGVDLSERMLIQGKRFMSENDVPIDLYLCDAANLPFQSNTFDVVTSYGAVNAYADTRKALEEMVRVTKKGGRLLFLDEQLYDSATPIERIYFKHVLAPHDTIDRCPVDLLPETLEDIRVHQVYEFYYICTARKRPG